MTCDINLTVRSQDPIDYKCFDFERYLNYECEYIHV